MGIKTILLMSVMFILSGCKIQPNQNSNETSSLNIEEVIETKEINLYTDTLKKSGIESISLNSLNDIEIDSNEKTLVYFGRKNCMYCRKLIIENERKFINTTLKILYIDTELVHQDELIKYNIEQVPSFLELTTEGSFINITLEDFERMIQHE